MEINDGLESVMPSNNILIPSESPLITDTSVVGEKAAGLSNFPKAWVPEYFVIGSELFRKWWSLQEKERGSDLNCANALSKYEKEEIVNALISLGIHEGEMVIVRSSSVTEGLEFRGQFISKVTTANLEAVLNACDDIFRDTISNSNDTIDDSFGLAILVQVYIDASVIGHLSNERRVAKRIQEWLFEVESGNLRKNSGRFAIKKNTLRATQTQLDVRDEKELIGCLRSIAAFVNDMGIRLHMEWVWHSGKLWIVQGDRDPEKIGPNPRTHIKKIRKIPSAPSLDSFVPVFSVSHDMWHKVQCQKDFKNAGLSTVPIWVLEDLSILANLQNGVIEPKLKADLNILLCSPIVIRMDIKSHVPGSPTEMLPRSDSIVTIEQAEQFLIEHSRSMPRTERFCFLVHHYIPSRSSAFCLAYPDHSRIRIDSIWGLPDGLLFYPHDSFEAPLDKSTEINRHIRYKDDYLAPTPDGHWLPIKAGKPWDWTPSINDEEIDYIGECTKRLANYLKACVQVMWFVDVPTEYGLGSSIPWYFELGEPPNSIDRADPRVFYRKRILISSKADLNKLQTNNLGNLQGNVLLLKPKPNLLREKPFIETVADIAKQYNLPVELQGSLLQHAFYQLKQLGVRIHCTDVFEPRYESKYFDKLVRDLIPLQIQRHGERESTVVLKGDDLIKVLKAKIVEEALELQTATTSENTIEELVDVFEVILAIARQGGLSIKELTRRAKLKRSKRGGFSKGLVLIETREVPLVEVNKPESKLLDMNNVSAKLTTQRNPKIQNAEITIPIVPPDCREAILDWKEVSMKIKVRYQNKEIVISLFKQPHEEATQPNLPESP